MASGCIVDGQKVLDKWILQGPTTYTVTRQLAQGTHQIVLEYFEANGGAVAKLAYEKTSEQPEPPPPVEPFAAEYFDNSTLTGGPVLTRTDDAVDFDWGDGSPNSGRPPQPVLRSLDQDKDLRCWHLSVHSDR